MEKQLKNVDVDDRDGRPDAGDYPFHDAGRNGTRPQIINPSRKKRIAAGSGMKVEDVNRLLKQFEQMQKMVRQMKGGKGRRRGMMPPGFMPPL